MIIIKNRIYCIALFFISLFLIFGMNAQASETQILKAKQIEKMAINHLIKELPWNQESLDITIYSDGKDITLPTGKKDLIYKIMGSNQRAGRVPMILEIRINDQFQKRIRINTKVLVKQKIIKTSRAVKRGEIFSINEIKEETIKTERPNKNAIKNLNYILGYEAVRNLPSGATIQTNFLKKPPLGKRGKKIMIMAKKGGMTITAPGILKQDGYKGEIVQVLNIDSKKIIYGNLVDSNTVTVKF